VLCGISLLLCPLEAVKIDFSFFPPDLTPHYSIKFSNFTNLKSSINLSLDRCSANGEPVRAKKNPLLKISTSRC
jgi:hypothetical protein